MSWTRGCTILRSEPEPLAVVMPAVNDSGLAVPLPPSIEAGASCRIQIGAATSRPGRLVAAVGKSRQAARVEGVGTGDSRIVSTPQTRAVRCSRTDCRPRPSSWTAAGKCKPAVPGGLPRRQSPATPKHLPRAGRRPPPPLASHRALRAVARPRSAQVSNRSVIADS